MMAAWTERHMALTDNVIIVTTKFNLNVRLSMKLQLQRRRAEGLFFITSCVYSRSIKRILYLIGI